MTDYKSFAHGFDGSHYVQVDWDILAPHIDFAIWKCSEGAAYRDETFPPACQAAYDRAIPFGAYHFFRVDPYLGLPFPSNKEIVAKYWPKPEKDAQLQNLIGALKNKKIYFLAIDIEAKYELESGKRIDPAWAAESARIFIQRVSDWRDATHPGLPLLVYTSHGYIGESAPNLVSLDWGKLDQWVAQWAVFPKNTLRLSWEQLKAYYLPAPAAKPIPFRDQTQVAIWQYSADRLILPGMYTRDGKTPRTTDLCLFMGTPAQFRAWCHYTGPVVKPEPDPEEPEPAAALTVKVKAKRLRLRAKPGLSGAFIGWLEQGTTLPVHGLTYASRGTWVDTGTGWACYADVFGQYLE